MSLYHEILCLNSILTPFDKHVFVFDHVKEDFMLLHVLLFCRLSQREKIAASPALPKINFHLSFPRPRQIPNFQIIKMFCTAIFYPNMIFLLHVNRVRA